MTETGTKGVNVFLALSVVMLVGLAGCQSLRSPTVFSRLAAPADEEVEFAQPHRLAVIWKDSTIPGYSGSKPVRGFGGRVYFYDAKDEPIRVDGDLVVYAFDDSKYDASGDAPKSRMPERKYVFRASELQQHFSQTKIGPSYSVWVPWDEVGGEQVSVSLLPMFKPVNGQIINSGQSLAVLPGKASNSNKVKFEQAEIKTVSHASALLPDGSIDASAIENRIENAQKRRATTINIPRGMARQLQNVSPSELPPVDPPGQSTEPNSAITEGHELTETAARLYQRLSDEAARTQSTIRPERQAVFGSPGPVR